MQIAGCRRPLPRAHLRSPKAICQPCQSCAALFFRGQGGTVGWESLMLPAATGAVIRGASQQWQLILQQRKTELSLKSGKPSSLRMPNRAA